MCLAHVREDDRSGIAEARRRNKRETVQQHQIILRSPINNKIRVFQCSSKQQQIVLRSSICLVKTIQLTLVTITRVEGDPRMKDYCSDDNLPPTAAAAKASFTKRRYHFAIGGGKARERGLQQ